MKKIIPVLLATAMMVLSACSTGAGEPSPTPAVDLAPDLEAYIVKNTPEDIAPTISNIRALTSHDEVGVTVRVVYTNGAYFVAAAQEMVPVILAGAEELGATLGKIQVMEYVETNESGIDNDTMISWDSKDDGETGTLLNSSGVHAKIPLADLGTYFENSVTPEIDESQLEGYQEEVMAVLDKTYEALEYVKEKNLTLEIAGTNREGTYTGYLQNGLPHGGGIFSAKNSEGAAWVYSGEWVDGQMSGIGETIWTSGQSHIGHYENCLPNGHGYLFTSDSIVHEGDFVDGVLTE